MPPYVGLRNHMITVSETDLGGNTIITTNAHIDIHLENTSCICSVEIKTAPRFFSCLPPSHLLQNVCHCRMTNPQQKTPHTPMNLSPSLTPFKKKNGVQVRLPIWPQHWSNVELKISPSICKPSCCTTLSPVTYCHYQNM